MVSERLKELDLRIEAAQLDREMHKKWQYQLNSVKTEQREAQAEMDRLKSKWQDEQKDVEQLTNRSIANLFYTLIGTKEKRLDKEQIEALQAKERYELTSSEASALEQDGRLLQQKIAQLGDWDSIIRDTMREKEQLLRSLDPVLTQRLDALTQDKNQLALEKKELTEARAAGENALRALRLAKEKFDSAKNWSTYDMLGGGMLSTHMKHSRIDEAQSLVTKANHALRTFQRELKDVEQAASEAHYVEVSDGLKFADYFFDGLIADWMVNDRINGSLETVNRAITRVEPIVKRLNQWRTQVEGRLEETARQYDKLILSYKM